LSERAPSTDTTRACEEPTMLCAGYSLMSSAMRLQEAEKVAWGLTEMLWAAPQGWMPSVQPSRPSGKQPIR